MKLAMVLFFAGVLLFGVGAVLWIALDVPPFRLVLGHGFPPAGGPTGRKLTIEGVTFVELSTGYFRMGSWFNCAKGDALGRICRAFGLPWGKQPREGGNEVPVRWLGIREPYWIAITELTNTQYERFDPEHQRDWPEDDDPVTSVSWEEARAYCDWLSNRGGVRARLPSEAEWENTCRAGSRGEYCFGDAEAVLGEYAWIGPNSGGQARLVGMKRANAWGLYDLHGNVWEWCEDRYHDVFRGVAEDGPERTAAGWPNRAIRGGSWRDAAVYCRSAVRSRVDPSSRDPDLGFRPCLGPLDR